MVEIRNAIQEDQKWIARLFDANSSVLGNLSGGTLFWRWTQSRNPRERFLVIENLAFAHYLIRKDGIKTLYEIAVDPSAKRQGLGRRLMEAIGKPIMLKTDAEHVESNAFYAGLGFALVGQARARSGKVLNIYQGW